MKKILLLLLVFGVTSFIVVNSWASVANTTYFKPTMLNKTVSIPTKKINTPVEWKIGLIFDDIEIWVSGGDNWICVWIGDRNGHEIGNRCWNLRVREATAEELLEPLMENEEVRASRDEILKGLTLILEEIRAMPDEGGR